MNIVYCFCKKGEEGKGWARDITAASDAMHRFVPFNQDGYLDLYTYWDAVQLDRLYQKRDVRLMRLYADFEQLVRTTNASAMVVCDAPPFHPDYLAKLPIYRVLYSHDDPESTYQRNIPYLHAYHHVFYVSPAYTKDLDMGKKMHSCGMVNSDLVPNGVLGFDYDETLDEKAVFEKTRDVDILFIGAFSWKKIDLLAGLKKAFGRRVLLRGYVRPKHNLYLTVRYWYPFWITPVSFRERLSLHQRAKIVVNAHNGYSVPNLGNQRLFYGPANGCMLLTDGHTHLHYYYKAGEEAVAYRGVDELITKCRYYLEHPEEREKIARAGYNRVIREYRFPEITRRSAELIREGMGALRWDPAKHFREDR
jgi:spore maturation protein CgeB